MQTNNNSLLAPPPADATTASTGAEADNRDKVSAANAAAPHIAPQSREHAHERLCNPNGEASHISKLWASASYSSSDPLGRSQSNRACIALRAHDACLTMTQEREQDVQNTKNEKGTAFRTRMEPSLGHEAGSLDDDDAPFCACAQFLNGHLEVPIDDLDI